MKGNQEKNKSFNSKKRSKKPKKSRPWEDDMREEERYNIDKLLDKRYNSEKGQFFYQVLWSGYGKKRTTWEPENILLEDVPDLIGSFNDDLEEIESNQRLESADNLKEKMQQKNKGGQKQKLKQNDKNSPTQKQALVVIPPKFKIKQEKSQYQLKQEKQGTQVISHKAVQKKEKQREKVSTPQNKSEQLLEVGVRTRAQYQFSKKQESKKVIIADEGQQPKVQQTLNQDLSQQQIQPVSMDKKGNLQILQDIHLKQSSIKSRLIGIGKDDCNPSLISVLLNESQQKLIDLRYLNQVPAPSVYTQISQQAIPQIDLEEISNSSNQQRQDYYPEDHINETQSSQLFGPQQQFSLQYAANEPESTGMQKIDIQDYSVLDLIWSSLVALLRSKNGIISRTRHLWLSITSHNYRYLYETASEQYLQSIQALEKQIVSRWENQPSQNTQKQKSREIFEIEWFQKITDENGQSQISTFIMEKSASYLKRNHPQFYINWLEEQLEASKQKEKDRQR
ncbi:UNKNOWN [Stylonychia lemnae]|uniref:Chromo domain-containing protein n=1 Tax=Stylonychia lemnae TaxID=5949 RepID=A0A078AR69_STYLE|nr:UNKNOWN [Stylonychia lemnae]|eukprot:CDW84714.1 UNKNOWN [Stylonychia lemnae]